MDRNRILFSLLFIAPILCLGQTNDFEWLTHKVWDATGTNAYTATIPKLSYYKKDLELKIKFINANNSSSVTLNVIGTGGSPIGTINLRKGGTTVLSSGDLAAGGTYTLSYDGTNFQVLNVAGSGGGGGDMVLASTQTNTGLKTFLNGTLGMRNVANTFTSQFTNTNSAARTYTLPNFTGRVLVNNQVYYTSTEGAISDAVLTEGSVTYGTDNTTVLQTILNNASETNPITVYWDGKYSISSTLTVKSNTTIIFSANAGVIARNGMNANIFQNANPTASTTHIDHDIYFLGNNYIINHNRGSQSLSETTAQGWLVPFKMVGVDHLGISGATILSNVTFAVWFMNCDYWSVSDVLIDWTPSQTQTVLFRKDGIHISGPSKYGYVRDAQIKASDDAVALNADDAWQSTNTAGMCAAAGVPTYDPYATFGDITDVDIRNVTLLPGSEFGFRLLSSGSAVKRITISNIKGITTVYGFNISNWNDGCPNNIGPGYISDVTIENSSLEVTPRIGLNYKSTYYTIGGNVSNIVFKNISRSNFTANTFPTFIIERNSNVENMSIENLQITGGVDNLPVIDVSGFVKNLSISNSNITQSLTTITAPLLKLNSTNGGYISTLRLDNILADHIDNLIDYSNGQIDYIKATGIKHSYPSTGEGTFLIGTGKVLKSLFLSGYTGKIISSGSGTITSSKGDGTVFGSTSSPVEYNVSSFTAPNGTLLSSYTPELGAAFVNQNTSVWEIQNGRLIPKTPNPPTNNWFTIADAGFTNVTLKVTVSVSAASALDIAQFYLKWTNSSNFVVINLSRSLAGCTFNNIVGGVNTTFGTFTTALPNDSFPHTVRVEANGTSFRVFSDETLIGTGTSGTAQTGTGAGLGTAGTASAPTIFTFDNYSVVAFDFGISASVANLPQSIINGNITATGTINSFGSSVNNASYVNIINPNSGSSAANGLLIGNDISNNSGGLVFTSSTNTTLLGTPGANSLTLYTLSAGQKLAFATVSNVRQIIEADGNISLFRPYSPASYGGGVKTLYFDHATTNPSTSVTGGGVMFVKSSDSKPYWWTGTTEYAMTGGAGGTYYAPNTLVANATDANFTATINGVHNILDGVASTNRVITIPTGSNGDVMKFYNTEDTRVWSFTGATVYLADRVTVVTELLYNVPCHMEQIDGRWIITN